MPTSACVLCRSRAVAFTLSSVLSFGTADEGVSADCLSARGRLTYVQQNEGASPYPLWRLVVLSMQVYPRTENSYGRKGRCTG